MTATEPPSLVPLTTLPSPSGLTRAWSSRAHPAPQTPLLATASSDKSVSIWSLKDFRLLSTISGGHKRSVRCVDWKDWGERRKEQIVPTGEVVDEEDGVDATEAGGIGDSEKPVILATGSFDANAGLWVWNGDAAAAQGQGGSREKNISQLDREVQELDMTNPPDPEDEDEEDWHFSTLLTGPDSEIKDLRFCPPHYGANLLATCSRDKSVWVWEEVEDDEWETIAVLSEHTGDVKCVTWCSGARMPKSVSDQTNKGESEETEVVGSREILASGSYDDTIRLWRDVEEEGDWMCVGVIEGHQGTVWDLSWEGKINLSSYDKSPDEAEIRQWEPRLISCSDDLTIRLWRRELSEAEKEKKKDKLSSSATSGFMQQRLPSIIRPTSTFEAWAEESRLPEVHLRSIYALDWSKRTGLVVSCGGDGTVAVYREVADTEPSDVVMNGTSEHEFQQEDEGRKKMKWIVVALLEAAHDEYEVNHVSWAGRQDKERQFEGEEVIVTTGDDGNVKVWTLPESLLGDLNR